MIFTEIREEIKYRILSLRKFIRIFLFDMSFKLILNYRIGKKMSESKFYFIRFLSILYKNKQISKFGCNISFKAELGYGISFPHPIGIVIGEGVVVKNNVRIFAGAKVFGDITVGENSIIGANAVVFNTVPPNCVAVGIPAKLTNSKKK